MSTRYILSTGALVAGGFLLVISRVFTAGSLEWTALGVSLGILVMAVAGLVAGDRARHLVGFGALGATAVWSAVASLVFTGTTLGWLTLADAGAVAAIALTSLAIHEFSTERVVHTLEVRHDSRTVQAA